mgnify:CR=1 FL=1
MKKKAVMRGLLGFPLGIAIGYIITIMTSLIWANGFYSPCVPGLVEQMGSEINAVILQAALSGLLGGVFASSSVIWEIENWSMAKQTGIYFAITALVMMPVAYFAKWLEPTVLGFLKYFGIFTLIFIMIWVIQYFVWKSKIEKMNQRIEKKREG